MMNEKLNELQENNQTIRHMADQHIRSHNILEIGVCIALAISFVNLIITVGLYLSRN